jgi:hypothetical protein
MIERLKNSWELAKASGQVLMADKELLLFPVFSGISMILVIISFFVPLAFAGFMTDQGGVIGFGAYVIFFIFYFVQYSVIIFFNSGLVGAALMRLEGKNPTVSDGFRIAFQNLTSILGYALIAATVGIILRIVREKAGILGKILSTLGGLAWSLATYLVIPVLVAQGVGPIDAIKSSTRILKRTWGEQIAGTIGIGFVFGMVTLLYSIIVIPVLILLAITNVPLAILLSFVGIMILGYLLLALISSTLKGIYSAALYRFATTGDSGMFDRNLLAGAFQEKA